MRNRNLPQLRPHLLSACLSLSTATWAGCGGEGADTMDPGPSSTYNSQCVITATGGVRCKDHPESSPAATTPATTAPSPESYPSSPPATLPAATPAPSTAAGLPAFLLQRWLSPIDKLAMQTIEFDGIRYEGRQAAKMENWQQTGTLGYQSQEFPYFLVKGDGASFTLEAKSASVQRYRILRHDAQSMDVEGPIGRATWYNCSAPVWPPSIHFKVCESH